MDWLEMHNMEFGECTVLGSADGSILMVDCGSMNLRIRETDIEVSQYVEQILMPRYQESVRRTFLLTHYHRDHLSGLRQIIKRDPYYFDRIYLPAAPINEQGRALLLEFAIYVFVFLGRQSEYSQMSISALRIFERLGQLAGTETIYTLGRGSSFDFGEVQYDVLWPDWECYPFPHMLEDVVEQLDVCLSSPFLGGSAPEFLQIKQEFCEEYVRCCDLCSEEHRGQLVEIDESIGRLKKNLDRLEELSDSLLRLPPAQDVVELLSRQSVRTTYSNAQNMASVVFHNHRVQEASYDDLLMTGDATQETFDEIAEDLYDAYYIFQAPHHGTSGSWCTFFQDIGKAHLLISNGDYQAAGLICKEYAEDEGIKHCTNPLACEWYSEHGCCCNQEASCWEYDERGASPCNVPSAWVPARPQNVVFISCLAIQTEVVCVTDDKGEKSNENTVRDRFGWHPADPRKDRFPTLDRDHQPAACTGDALFRSDSAQSGERHRNFVWTSSYTALYFAQWCFAV